MDDLLRDNRQDIVITGGAGFLGLRLAGQILRHGLTIGARHIARPNVILVDRSDVPDPGLIGASFVAADVADPQAMAQIITPNCAAIFHLAAVVSAQAEAEFDLGLRVNLGGTKAVLSAARAAGPGVTMIATSSLAVYGPDVPLPVTEITATQPQNSYGMAKAMTELLCTDHRRRGWVDARVLRLPTIVIRPGRPNQAASSFASSILRDPLNGAPAICPVPPDTALWLATPETAIAAMIHATKVPADAWPRFAAVNVPGQTLTVAEMIAALPPEAQEQITFTPDPKIADIVTAWPARFDTSLAVSLGFAPQDLGAQALLTRYQR